MLLCMALKADGLRSSTSCRQCASATDRMYSISSNRAQHTSTTRPTLWLFCDSTRIYSHRASLPTQIRHNIPHQSLVTRTHAAASSIGLNSKLQTRIQETAHRRVPVQCTERRMQTAEAVDLLVGEYLAGCTLAARVCPWSRI